jgi:hypothetical protein
MKINGDHFNNGDRVWLGYYQVNSRRLIQGYWVNATPNPNLLGSSFGHKTDMLDCGKGSATAHIRAPTTRHPDAGHRNSTSIPAVSIPDVPQNDRVRDTGRYILFSPLGMPPNFTRSISAELTVP